MSLKIVEDKKSFMLFLNYASTCFNNKDGDIYTKV